MQGAYKIYDVWDPITNTHNTLPNKTFVDEFCAAAQIIPTTGEVTYRGRRCAPARISKYGHPEHQHF